MKLLENVQRRWTKRSDGFENLAYSQRLKDLDLFSVEGRLLKADVIKCCKKKFNSKCKIIPEDIFVLGWNDITRHHRFENAREIVSIFFSIIIYYNFCNLL